VLFEFFWGVVPAGAHYLVEGTVPGPVVPAWVVLLERAQPLSAFEAAAPLAVPRVEAGIQLSPGDAPTATGLGTTALADRLGGPAPPYLDPWAAVATLFGWTVVPLLVGWYRFRQADLQ
jgi:ABC-2 type transport system permease protein